MNKKEKMVELYGGNCMYQTRYSFWYSPAQAACVAALTGHTDTRINGKAYSECRRLSESRNTNWTDARYVGMGTMSEVSVNGVKQ